MAGMSDVLQISAAGMRAQGERLRVVAENIANAEATATTPGGQPYRRKMVIFQNVLDKQTGKETVKVTQHAYDQSAFNKKYDPNHPAADAQGYVLYPNVNSIVEMMDMREARRGYEANLDAVQISKSMLSQTISLLQK
jgi:flagellar basal-body rod protein FlgC